MDKSDLTANPLARPLLKACGLRAGDVTRVWAVLLAGGLVVLAFSFYRSYVDIRRYGGVDLRARVVGARAVRAGLNPYTHDWTEGTTDRLLDPARRQPGPSRFAYPPMLLLLTYATAELPYGWQRVMWFLLEWAALLASVLLLARTVGSRRGRLLFLVLALYFFAASSFWRLHVERGTYYVFALLFLTLGGYLCLRRPKYSWLAGVCFGLAAAVRAPFILMLAPLWILGLRRASAAMLGTFLLVVLSATQLVGVGAWKDFSHTVDEWGRAMLDRDYLERQYGPPLKTPCAAEGVELCKQLFVPFANTTFPGLFEAKKRLLPAPLSSLDSNTVSKGLAGLAACAVLLLAWRALGRRRVRLALYSAVMLVLTVEFFLPLKFDYADVLMLFPLALGMPLLVNRRAGFLPAVVVLLGLFLGATVFQEPGNARDELLGSLLRAVLLLAAFDYYLLLKLRGGRRPRRVTAAADQL